MRLELAKYLFDIQSAAHALSEFVAGRNWDDYQRDAMLRAAVERQFEIIGEALAQLARRDVDLAARIDEHRRIIAFRNILTATPKWTTGWYRTSSKHACRACLRKRMRCWIRRHDAVVHLGKFKLSGRSPDGSGSARTSSS